MRLPIALALGWPDRIAGAAPACDFRTASTWDFEPLNDVVFPAVQLARDAGTAGGCMPAIFNAANEEAASAFLGGRIRFPSIIRTIEAALDAGERWARDPGDVDEVLAAEGWARSHARDLIDREG